MALALVQSLMADASTSHCTATTSGHGRDSESEPHAQLLVTALAAAKRALHLQMQLPATAAGVTWTQEEAPLARPLPLPSPADFKLLLPAAQHAAMGGRQPTHARRDEATKRFVARLGIQAYDKFRVLGLYTAGYLIYGTTTAEALTAASNFFGLLYFVDDLCFDGDDMPHYQLGAAAPVSRRDHAAYSDFSRRRWCAALRAEKPPAAPAPGDLYAAVDRAVRETGRDLRALSASCPAWFPSFAAAVDDYTDACLAMRRHFAAACDDMAAYTFLRLRNSGFLATSRIMELCLGSFLPPDARNHPVVLRLLWAAAAQGGLVNDVFSYDKDQGDDDRDFSPLRMVMRQQGVSLEQAVRWAVQAADSYVHDFEAADAELPPRLADDPSVRRFVLSLRELVSGNLHFHLVMDRYAWPASLSRH